MDVSGESLRVRYTNLERMIVYLTGDWFSSSSNLQEELQQQELFLNHHRLRILEY